MPRPTKGARLGGSPAHQKAILSNLATSLFEHGAITTTEAKARRLRPLAEKLISKAKRGDLHNRRQVMSVIRDKSVVHVLFTEIGPRYAERPGGYTRITKIGPRKGDNAPMAVIELVEAEFTAKTHATKKATSPAKKATPAPAAAETPVEAPVVEEPAAAEVDASEEPTSDVADEQVEAQTAVAEQEPHTETPSTEDASAEPPETQPASDESGRG